MGTTAEGSVQWGNWGGGIHEAGSGWHAARRQASWARAQATHQRWRAAAVRWRLTVEDLHSAQSDERQWFDLP